VVVIFLDLWLEEGRSTSGDLQGRFMVEKEVGFQLLGVFWVLEEAELLLTHEGYIFLVFQPSSNVFFQ
jgi:hypothetical protein